MMTDARRRPRITLGWLVATAAMAVAVPVIFLAVAAIKGFAVPDAWSFYVVLSAALGIAVAGTLGQSYIASGIPQLRGGWLVIMSVLWVVLTSSIVYLGWAYLRVEIVGYTQLVDILGERHADYLCLVVMIIGELAAAGALTRDAIEKRKAEAVAVLEERIDDMEVAHSIAISTAESQLQEQARVHQQELSALEEQLAASQHALAIRQQAVTTSPPSYFSQAAIVLQESEQPWMDVIEIEAGVLALGRESVSRQSLKAALDRAVSKGELQRDKEESGRVVWALPNATSEVDVDDVDDVDDEGSSAIENLTLSADVKEWTRSGQRR